MDMSKGHTGNEVGWHIELFFIDYRRNCGEQEGFTSHGP